MTTQKQIEANRRNAEKSSGPRTDEGKQRSRLNAWQHGMAAEHVLGPDAGEVDRVAFESLRAGLRSSMMPHDDLEEELVDRLAVASFKRRQAEQLESAIWLDCFTAPAGGDSTSAVDDPRLARLLRYRGSIEREFHRCLNQLRAVQRVRDARIRDAAEAVVACDVLNDDRADDHPRTMRMLTAILLHNWAIAHGAPFQVEHDDEPADFGNGTNPFTPLTPVDWESKLPDWLPTMDDLADEDHEPQPGVTI